MSTMEERYEGDFLEAIDLPEGASVEDTDAAAQAVARILLGMEEVASVRTHAAISSARTSSHASRSLPCACIRNPSSHPISSRSSFLGTSP